MSDYLKVLILSVLVPFACSFYRPLRFYENLKALLVSVGLVVLIFGAWDILATARGHWHFNPQGVGSLKIINLPLEEVLFFIVIPFCCIFTWEAINYIKNKIQ
ncbi:MAG: lycopene cyclase domain-containing protein [Candidatus Omnitrophica bacterium]|nr:lycopene cyclase domain-containing protein [Candidatus Omnitrophota bacterium]